MEYFILEEKREIRNYETDEIEDKWFSVKGWHFSEDEDDDDIVRNGYKTLSYAKRALKRRQEWNPYIEYRITKRELESEVVLTTPAKKMKLVPIATKKAKRSWNVPAKKRTEYVVEGTYCDTLKAARAEVKKFRRYRYADEDVAIVKITTEPVEFYRLEEVD